MRSKQEGNDVLKTIPRIMLAAGASGSGKTLLTCGLLQVLVNRRIKTVSLNADRIILTLCSTPRSLEPNPGIWIPFFTGGRDHQISSCQKQCADCEMAVMEGGHGILRWSCRNHHRQAPMIWRGLRIPGNSDRKQQGNECFPRCLHKGVLWNTKRQPHKGCDLQSDVPYALPQNEKAGGRGTGNQSSWLCAKK